MLYEEYRKWLNRNCPPALPFDDFQEFCALVGVITIQNTLNAKDLTLDEMIKRFFDKPSSLN